MSRSAKYLGKLNVNWVTLFDLVVLGSTILYAILRQKSPMRYFDETGIISWFSFLQLLVLCVLSWYIFSIRNQAEKITNSRQSSHKLWKWIAWGFLYLAIDEIAQIHENLDWLIHQIFAIEETRLTDSMDDIFVLCYSLFVLYLLYKFREEFRHYLGVIHLFAIAFSLKLLMVALDIYTNDETVFADWFSDPEQGKILLDWMQTLEDSFKILAEGVFIGAFLACIKIAKRIPQRLEMRRNSQLLPTPDSIDKS
ncbi:MAG: hypothetical protein AB4372_15050 [Xenococcus sp. (in: cyanobacteria)]